MAASPQPLPSLPPSPTEEDISRAGTLIGEETTSDKSSKARGKEREHLQPPSAAYLNSDDVSSSDDETAVEGYPPTKELEAESRRVEENLRRWEMRERERRKAARESTATVPPTSLLADVTRQASSLLWPNKRDKRPSTGGTSGFHQVPVQMRTTEDGSVPLDDVHSFAPSPSPEPGLDNPFKTPMASTLTLNEPEQSAIMTASNSLPPTTNDTQLATPTARRPNLPGSTPSFSHPPPQPLNLPEPRTPPPRTATPHPNVPPEPIPPPTVKQTQEEEPVPRGKPRWWTDWLCGCMDSGDHQTARTNPFE